jgi:hypothetical protein
MRESTESQTTVRNGWTKPFHLAALALIAALAIGTYVVTGQIVREQETATRLVAVAARQVVLSQRIAGLCVELASHSNLKKQTNDRTQLPDRATDDIKELTPEKAEDKTRDDLRQAVALMQVAHQALINGSSDMKIAKPTANAINKVYFGEPYQLDHQVVYFLAAASALADATPETLNQDNQSLVDVQLAARQSLFAAESAAVSACAAESSRVIAQMRRLLNTVFGLTLFAILADLAVASGAFAAKTP